MLCECDISNRLSEGEVDVRRHIIDGSGKAVAADVDAVGEPCRLSLRDRVVTRIESIEEVAAECVCEDCRLDVIAKHVGARQSHFDTLDSSFTRLLKPVAVVVLEHGSLRSHRVERVED